MNVAQFVRLVPYQNSDASPELVGTVVLVLTTKVTSANAIGPNNDCFPNCVPSMWKRKMAWIAVVASSRDICGHQLSQAESSSSMNGQMDQKTQQNATNDQSQPHWAMLHSVGDTPSLVQSVKRISRSAPMRLATSSALTSSPGCSSCLVQPFAVAHTTRKAQCSQANRWKFGPEMWHPWFTATPLLVALLMGM